MTLYPWMEKPGIALGSGRREKTCAVHGKWMANSPTHKCPKCRKDAKTKKYDYV